MNEYKDAAALLHLAARSLKQAHEKILPLDRHFADDLASTVFAAECYESTWKKHHAPRLRKPSA